MNLVKHFTALVMVASAPLLLGDVHAKPVALNQEESKMLCDELIEWAERSDEPMLLLEANLKKSPLHENDRKRLLANKRQIALTESWTDANLHFEALKKDASGKVLIPVLYGEDGGSMRVTFAFIREGEDKMIVQWLLQTISRVVTHE